MAKLSKKELKVLLGRKKACLNIVISGRGSGSKDYKTIACLAIDIHKLEFRIENTAKIENDHPLEMSTCGIEAFVQNTISAYNN